MTRRILTAAEGESWESQLISALSRGSHSIEVARRCVDLVDLLAAAGSGLAEAVLVDVSLRRFDLGAVERLSSAGVAVVGVVRPGSVADEERLHALGVAFAVPSDADVDVVSSVVETAVLELATGARADRGLADPSFASGWLKVPADASSLDLGQPDLEVTGRRGSVVAVWGPTGAPGRTSVAVTLADEIARLDSSVLLVDADVYGGVVASSFGLLDESPGLAAACRQAQSRRLDVASLAQLAWQVNPKLRVLTGIQRAERWPELRVSAIEQVLAVGRALCDFVIVDLGFNLETDEELSFDTAAPRRNGATLTVLDNADVILAVGSADPVGVQRLVRGLDALNAVGSPASTMVVLNKVRRSAVPGDTSEELIAALDRFSGVRPQSQLPYDLEALDLASTHGRTVAEVSPNSPFRRAVVDLAASVVGVPVPVRGRRRR
jgi:Flp pilus assembly CpaE family ATPase